MDKAKPFRVGNVSVRPGGRQTVNIQIGFMSNHLPMHMSAHVIHGQKPGPVMFVSAAVHGDEIIGVEIIRRLLSAPVMNRVRGTLIAVPIVNAYGFLSHSRYLPDRRDLNRAFPGSSSGSLAAQLAETFMREIVARADVGIDLHSAAVHRENLPQIRITEDNGQLFELAKSFGAPVILKAPLREGSMRQSALEVGTKVLLYEAGEGLRFDEVAIRVGVSGVLRVMRALGMVPASAVRQSKMLPSLSRNSYWVRAPEGGILRMYKACGDSVAEGDVIGMVSDPFGETEFEVVAKYGGLIIGRTRLPVVNQGDGLFHIAQVQKLDMADHMERIEKELAADPLYDEDEII
ncbi:succinylglutamate desuccinylase/aspartoacylase family protein [Cucumibacter marinus]|uniref:succinylglutamate desuccinylase/aspartoacylase family protein n=1 Tax=Cucumibacter marinus TaxID=1121252 RepID=UPI000415E1C3|nr:succinylglutamate desuccinylase/aspartoacylase family protein [Cucumibacter marinus]